MRTQKIISITRGHDPRRPAVGMKGSRRFFVCTERLFPLPCCVCHFAARVFIRSCTCTCASGSNQCKGGLDFIDGVVNEDGVIRRSCDRYKRRRQGVSAYRTARHPPPRMRRCMIMQHLCEQKTKLSVPPTQIKQGSRCGIQTARQETRGRTLHAKGRGVGQDPI